MLLSNNNEKKEYIMMRDKLRIQYKENSQWKTCCIWLRQDMIGAHHLQTALKSKYGDARIVNYDEATLQDKKQL